jgi:hypothetical protein
MSAPARFGRRRVLVSGDADPELLAAGGLLSLATVRDDVPS